jgi:TRAP-type C4-dicarboxylate transport system permease small subunit
VNRLSRRNQKLSGILVNILFFAAVVVVSGGFITVIGSLKKYKMITPIMQVPKYVIYAVIMGILMIMLIRLIQDSILLWKEYREMPRNPLPEREGEANNQSGGQN